MSKKFIPNSDSAFQTMATAFATTISRDPEKFGFSKPDSEVLTRCVKEFASSIGGLSMRRTCSPSAIGVKNEKRKVAEEMIRRMANVVRASDRISTSDKVSLGIHERPKKLRKRTVPFAPPELIYQGPPKKAGPNCGMHQLAFRERFTFIGKSKPNGAVRVEIFVDLLRAGQAVPRSPGECLDSRPWYLRSFSKSPCKVRHPVPMEPMRVVYWARWADAKGEVGPFSQACVADWVGPMGNGVPLLGAMPTVRVLENDTKHLTAVAHLRQLECASGQKMLPDSGQTGDAAKQLPPPEAA